SSEIGWREGSRKRRWAVDTRLSRRCVAGMRGHYAMLGVLLVLAAPLPAQQRSDPLELANPFLGVDNGGNTVPGASVPFGFVSLSPDTSNGSTSGYDS